MRGKTVIKLSITFIIIVVASFVSLYFVYRFQESKDLKHSKEIIQDTYEEGNLDYKNTESEMAESKVKPEVKPKIKSEDKIINKEKPIQNKDIQNKNDLKLALKGALTDFKETLSLRGYNVNQNDCGDAITEVLNESAEIDYGYKGGTYNITTHLDGTIFINYTLNYKEDRNALIAKRDKVNKKVKDIIDKNIKSSMSKYEKELFFHDYIVNNTQYNTYYINQNIIYQDDYTAYGVLIDKKGVCEGYAKAFNLLCKSAGIECILVKGEAKGPHAWNMVKLDDGKWYNVDVTWDDPIMSDNSVDLVKTKHTYFNIPTVEINKDHKINQGYPVASGTKYLRDNINIKEYDSKGNLFTNISNVSELKATVKTQLIKKSLTITCKIKSFNIDQNSIFNIVQNVAKENFITIKGMNLLTDGTPILYFKLNIKY